MNREKKISHKSIQTLREWLDDSEKIKSEWPSFTVTFLIGMIALLYVGIFANMSHPIKLVVVYSLLVSFVFLLIQSMQEDDCVEAAKKSNKIIISAIELKAEALLKKNRNRLGGTHLSDYLMFVESIITLPVRERLHFFRNNNIAGIFAHVTNEIRKNGTQFAETYNTYSIYDEPASSTLVEIKVDYRSRLVQILKNLEDFKVEESQSARSLKHALEEALE